VRCIEHSIARDARIEERLLTESRHRERVFLARTIEEETNLIRREWAVIDRCPREKWNFVPLRSLIDPHIEERDPKTASTLANKVRDLDGSEIVGVSVDPLR